jgi:hypothetical protein
MTTGFKIQSLGGRGIIENEIKILQASDKKRELEGYHVFILDLDNRPTTLTSTDNVIVIQWDRYSFENNLLNTDKLYDVVKELSTKDFPSSRAEFARKVKELAFGQIEKTILQEDYGKKIPETISLNKKNIQNLSIHEISELLSSKLEAQKEYLEEFEKDRFKIEFVSFINERIQQTKDDWDENWKKKCKGKELLLQVYNIYGLTNYKSFIKNLIRGIKEGTEEWTIIKGKIEPVLQRKNS